MISSIGLLAFFAIAFPAFAVTEAAVKFSCPPLETLESNVKSCVDNSIFSAAATRCFKDLQTHIRNRTIEIEALMAAKAKALEKQGHEQTGDIAASTGDYQALEEAMKEMLFSAQRSRGQVNGYLGKMFFPEGFDSALLQGLNSNEYLKANGCYANTRSKVESTIASIDRSIMELRKGYSKSKTLSIATGTRGTGLSSNGAKAAKGTQGKGAGQKIEGDAVKDDSDISGLKQDELKRKKGRVE